ncbi:hypothetical protein CR513_31246, partial [Mucuna pruriens]
MAPSSLVSLCINEHLKITHKVTSVEHPQANGQAKAANKVILSELQRCLYKAKGLWVKHLPNILWAYHCSPQSSTRETPYQLMYGIDAMILVKIGKPSLRRNSFDPFENPLSLRVVLDLVEEIKEQACMRQAACKQRVARQYNSKVRPHDLDENDLRWQRTRDARKKKEDGKLAPNWEGPFWI